MTKTKKVFISSIFSRFYVLCVGLLSNVGRGNWVKAIPESVRRWMWVYRLYIPDLALRNKIAISYTKRNEIFRSKREQPLPHRYLLLWVPFIPTPVSLSTQIQNPSSFFFHIFLFSLFSILVHIFETIWEMKEVKKKKMELFRAMKWEKDSFRNPLPWLWSSEAPRCFQFQAYFW